MTDYAKVSIWTDQDGYPMFKLADGSVYVGPLYAWVGVPDSPQETP